MKINWWQKKAVNYFTDELHPYRKEFQTIKKKNLIYNKKGVRKKLKLGLKLLNKWLNRNEAEIIYII